MWEKVKKLFQTYADLWTGPDVPIFIFPVHQTLFKQASKNGYSFKDKMFLFLPSDIEDKELEALFVTRHHHICRINRLNKPLKNFTLLDSLIMEGSAEHAVLDCCGEDFIIKWNKIYATGEMERIWRQHYKQHINMKTSDPLHDRLLYGQSFSKPMLGYNNRLLFS